MKQFNGKYRKYVYADNGDMANLFNIYSREHEGDVVDHFNINRTVAFNGTDNPPPFLFTAYTARAGDTWTLLSHRFYGTIEYWWLICKFNGVTDPTGFPVEGEVLKIPSDALRRDLSDKIKSA